METINFLMGLMIFAVGVYVIVYTISGSQELAAAMSLSISLIMFGFLIMLTVVYRSKNV